MFQVPEEDDFPVSVLGNERRDFAVFVDVFADQTVHDTPRVSSPE